MWDRTPLETPLWALPGAAGQGLSSAALRSLLWLGFNLWPGNFRVLQAQPKTKTNTMCDSIYWQQTI